MCVLRDVIGKRLPDGQAVALGDRGEMFFYRFDFVFIDERCVAESTKISRHVYN